MSTSSTTTTTRIMQLLSSLFLSICLVHYMIPVPIVSSFTPQSQLFQNHVSLTNHRSQSSSSPVLLPSLDVIVTAATRRRHPVRSPTSSSLKAVVDPPMLPASDHQDDKRKKKKEDEWTPVNGGFLPNFLRRRRKTTSATSITTATTTTTKALSVDENLKSKSKQKKTVTTIPNVTTIDNILDYKSIVVDEEKSIVVVRFFASWCRSCKASEPSFRNMVSRFSSSAEQGIDDGHGEQHGVKFVMVQLTKDTAYLQEGLGVPSIPYVHVYHPEGGLVEESKFSKGYYADFTRVLESYIAGSCDVPPEEDMSDDDDDVVGAFE